MIWDVLGDRRWEMGSVQFGVGTEARFCYKYNRHQKNTPKVLDLSKEKWKEDQEKFAVVCTSWSVLCILFGYFLFSPYREVPLSTSIQGTFLLLRRGSWTSGSECESWDPNLLGTPHRGPGTGWGDLFFRSGGGFTADQLIPVSA